MIGILLSKTAIFVYLILGGLIDPISESISSGENNPTYVVGKYFILIFKLCM